MGNTTQHGWPTPDEGESNYEDTFADFFEQIDDAVEIRGVDSDKSNYSAVAGAKYFATDTEKLYIGDGSSWNHVGSTGKNPTFDSIDTESLPNTYSGSFNPFHYSARYDGGLPHQRRLKPTFQLVDPRTQSATLTTWVEPNGNEIYVTNGAGVREHVATIPDAIIGTQVEFAAPAPFNSEWLVITDSGTNSTAYIYDSVSDIESNTQRASHSIISPLHGTLTSWIDGSANRGWLWGEYINDGSDVNIRRIDQGGNLTTPLGPLSDVDHFQSGDHDLYNDGEMYVTTGDAGDEVRWYKSTDYGQTWSELSNIGGSQKWRALRIVFDENYLYWGTDGLFNGASRLYRAERSDIAGTVEEIATVSDRDYVWALTRCFYPDGILIGQRTPPASSSGVTSVPLQFYDFGIETLKTIRSISVDTSLDGRPGVRYTMPYQNMQDGTVYGDMVSQPNPTDASTMAFSMDMPQLQHDQ